jgi:Ca2+-binding EF-hand superfamily protein
MQAPLLPAALGPRSFVLPRDCTKPTPAQLLEQQAQISRAMQALQLQQARRQQTNARHEGARNIAAVVATSLFSGTHLVAGDVEGAYGRGEGGGGATVGAATASAIRGGHGSQSARGSLRHAPAAATATEGSYTARSDWNRTPAAPARPRVTSLDELDASGVDALSPRRRLNHWSRRVDRRQRAADGSGATVSLHSPSYHEDAEAEAMMSATSVADDDDPFPISSRRGGNDAGESGEQPSSLQESLRSYTGQWWVRLHNSENKANTSPYYVGNRSLYYDYGHHKPAAAAVPVSGVEESKEASATPTLTATHPQQQHLPRIILPSATAASAQASSSRHANSAAQRQPAPPLRKLIHSSPLDDPVDLPPAAAAPAAMSTLRSLLCSAPAGSAARQAAATHAATLAASGPRVLGTRHKSSRFGPAHKHKERLQHILHDNGTQDGGGDNSSSTARHELKPHEAATLTPAWSHNPNLLVWKRRPSTMTLKDPPQQQQRQSDAAAAGAAPHHTAYDAELSRVRAIRSATRSARHTRFQYDAVSELHGFLSQKNIKALLKATNYNRRELYVIFCRFKALCALSPSPHGIDQRTFKTGVARLAVEDDRFVERVYALVDDDASGAVEFGEFLHAMAALEKGELEAKVRFFFSVYDLDGDGMIGRQDLSTMFHSSSMLDDDATTEEVVQTFVERVFTALGAKESGDKITFDDVMKYMKHEGEKEDVWDLFGRSMLQDLGARPGQ